jgi:hypothetical protein
LPCPTVHDESSAEDRSVSGGAARSGAMDESMIKVFW